MISSYRLLLILKFLIFEILDRTKVFNSLLFISFNISFRPVYCYLRSRFLLCLCEIIRYMYYSSVKGIFLFFGYHFYCLLNFDYHFLRLFSESIWPKMKNVFKEFPN